MSENISLSLSQEYAAIGHLVAECSVLEMTAHICVRLLLQIEEETSRLLIGEPRIKDLLDILKKSAAICQYSDDRKLLLTELCTQAIYANEIRRIIAHKPFILDGGHMVFHNRMSAKSSAAIFEYKCTTAELHNLASLTRAVTESMLHIVGIEGPVLSDSIKLIRAQLAFAKKPPLPAIPSPQSPTKTPKQKPPH